MRAVICWVIIALLPSSVLGAPQSGAGSQDGAASQNTAPGSLPPSQTPSPTQPASGEPPASPAGVVYGDGSVFLDGSQLSNSAPVMTGDVVEIKDAGDAHVEMDGSTAKMQANSIVRFRDGGVVLDQGSVSMGTGRSQKVFARDFEITPVNPDWTLFEVVRTAGLIHISAIKNDVEIRCGTKDRTIIKEGHDLTRADAENCGLAANTTTPTAAAGPYLASPWAQAAAASAGAGLLGWVLSHLGDDSVSPDSPDQP